MVTRATGDNNIIDTPISLSDEGFFQLLNLKEDHLLERVKPRCVFLTNLVPTKLLAVLNDTTLQITKKYFIISPSAPQNTQIALFLVLSLCPLKIQFPIRDLLSNLRLFLQRLGPTALKLPSS